MKNKKTKIRFAKFHGFISVVLPKKNKKNFLKYNARLYKSCKKAESLFLSKIILLYFARYDNLIFLLLFSMFCLYKRVVKIIYLLQAFS